MIKLYRKGLHPTVLSQKIYDETYFDEDLNFFDRLKKISF